jgi:hypothetical protein
MTLSDEGNGAHDPHAHLNAEASPEVSLDGVVHFDLVDEGYEGFNKFIPYYLYPETTYTVALTRGSQRTKISVGSSPWAPRPRTHNIAKICERYGGGGHAVVGAISLKPEEVEKGRVIMKEIVAELSPFRLVIKTRNSLTLRQ